MKKSDVRIGNIVGIPIEWATVNEIDDECFVLLQNGDYASIPWTAIEPVPMSPEWRAKLNFNGSLTLMFGKNGLLRSTDFVHDAQNLYHALTGKEL